MTSTPVTSTAATTTEAILARLEKRRDDRPPAELTSQEQVRLAAAAALDKKAEELRIFDLSEVSDFTDLFLICSGGNERQVQAIADNVQDSLRRAKVRPLHVEGYNHGRWVLIDYGGDLVVHVFHREARGFYDLERLWSDAPELTERFVAGEVALEPAASHDPGADPDVATADPDATTD